jgi:hypothetical protein
MAALCAISSQAFAQGDGLTGTYYQWPGGTASPPPPPPGSPEPGAAAWTATATRIDTTVNFADTGGANWAPAGVGPNNFTVVWTGYVLTGTDTGTYTFYFNTDDGSRLWVTNPMAAGGETITGSTWINQAPASYQGTVTLKANTFYPVRYEFFQTGGGTAAKLSWSSASVAQQIIPQANLFDDASTSVVLPPTGLTATAGFNQVVLGWTAGAGATSFNIYQAAASGGPYTKIASGVTGGAYTDTTAVYPNTYFYVVEGVNATGLSPYSNEASASPNQPLVLVSPTSLNVSEGSGVTSFTLTATKSPWSGQFDVTVSSSNTAQALVSTTGAPAASVVVTFLSSGPASQQVFVTGVDDFIVGDPQTVIVTVGPIQNSTDTTNYPNGFDPVDVTVSVLEADNPGILTGPPSGVVVDGGSPVTFSVVLNSKPAASTNPVTPGTVVLDVSNSQPQVCTVTPAQLTFDSNNWNQPQLVTITPLNDNGQNPAVFFSVSSVTVTLTPNPAGTDPIYAAASPVSVTAAFVDPYPPPSLKPVWGGSSGSGSSGGCGLTGLEALLLLALARRRTAKK